MSSEVSTELLPAVLREFVRLIGLQATMKIVHAFGGRRLYVPVNPNPEHRLAKLIGLENLEHLSSIYGAEDHFDIPKAERALRHLRDTKIRSEYGPKSASALAAEHHLTERQIWNIVGRPRAEHAANQAQDKLFG